eukprot:1376566-Amorphochlora_amoeboformis.AAC.1
MKTLLVQREIEIPEGFEAKVKSGVVTITHERGKLTKDFRHAKVGAGLFGRGFYGTHVEVRNFVGQKMTKICNLPEGVTCRRSTEVKDELVFEGADIQKVSQSAAQVHQLALVRNKDIRKFLDGIYVSETGHVIDE